MRVLAILLANGAHCASITNLADCMDFRSVTYSPNWQECTRQRQKSELLLAIVQASSCLPMRLQHRASVLWRTCAGDRMCLTTSLCLQQPSLTLRSELSTPPHLPCILCAAWVSVLFCDRTCGMQSRFCLAPVCCKLWTFHGFSNSTLIILIMPVLS